MPRTSFADRLLNWWDAHGRKDLPWQHPRTPYRVWVSEIMLQQTQVTTVIPYFERFIKRFPDVASLAAARQEDVLAAWAGLGYYARARNLHKAANELIEQHQSVFPESAEALNALPGIGKSTANAIISQAWDRPATVVDGNVKRVISRHDGIMPMNSTSQTEKAYWESAESRLPQARAADYTQAIMDLGATLCTRRNPQCTSCPVADDCYARLNDAIDLLPGKAKAVKVTARDVYMLVLCDKDKRVLLEKRPAVGIWGGMWSLPDAENPETLAQRFGLGERDMLPLPTVQHRLTHLALTLTPLLCEAGPNASGVASSAEQEWFGAAEWNAAGLPAPVLKLLNALQKENDNDTNG